MYTRRHWNEAAFTKDHCNGTIRFFQLNIYGTSLDENDVNNFMDLERSLHKKYNQIPMAAAQRLISRKMRRCVGICGVQRRSYQIPSKDVTFEARPLCNLTRCTALRNSDIPMIIRHFIA